MARSASKILFEMMGLTRFGKLPGIPPKPLSARMIAKLADKLDRADVAYRRMLDAAEICGPRWAEGVAESEIERVIADEEGIRRRFRDTKERYSDAVYARVRYQKYRLETSKQIPKSTDKFALDSAWYAASNHYDLIADLGGLAYARELIDANAAFMLADHALEVAKTKFEDAARFERRTGIRKCPRSSVRLVTDGYVRTGKYKMIDGARVPVLEKIQ